MTTTPPSSCSCWPTAITAVLVSLLLVVATATPAKPVVPAQFVSTVDVSLKGGTLPFSNATFMFDSIAKATSIKDLWSPVPGSAQYGLNVTAYATGDTLFYVNNGVCRQYPGGFNNMFAFVQSPLTKYAGSVTIRGRVCDLWTLAAKPFFLSLASQGNTPVQLNSTIVGDGIETTTLFYFYPDLTPTAPPPALLVPPKRCYGPGFTCPHGTVANITMYAREIERERDRDRSLARSLERDRSLTRTRLPGQGALPHDRQLGAHQQEHGRCSRRHCLHLHHARYQHAHVR